MTGRQTWARLRGAAVTLAFAASLVGVVLAASLLGPGVDRDATLLATAPASPSAVLTIAPPASTSPPESPKPTASTASTAPPTVPRTKQEARRLETMAPEEIAAEAVEARPRAAPPGAGALAEAAEQAAALKPFSFVLTSFNVLGSQHSAPGGAAAEYADGGVRAQWAAGLIASYDSDVVGFGELQVDQYAVMASAAPGYAFYPGTSLGGAGVPTNLMWKTSVWESTYQTSVTIPFMDSTRPMPVVRLRHLETGREIYVMNVHNSPKDRQGREDERDKAEAIEIAAINELARDELPIFVIGDFNEKAEVFCRVTAETPLVAASGGSNGVDGGACRPPAAMRVDWIFGSREVAFPGFRIDASPAVRRITDHAVLTTGVTVPLPVVDPGR